MLVPDVDYAHLSVLAEEWRPRTLSLVRNANGHQPPNGDLSNTPVLRFCVAGVAAEHSSPCVVSVTMLTRYASSPYLVVFLDFFLGTYSANKTASNTPYSEQSPSGYGGDLLR